MHQESTLNPALQDRILVLAGGVRHWCEALAAKSLASPDLQGYCAIASARLWSELTRAGIAAEIWEAQAWCNHVYVIVDDHVVDVTATQFPPFRNCPVVIQHVKSAELLWWWRQDRPHASDRALHRHQIRSGWPQDQIVLGSG